MFCPNCGAKTVDNARFCTSCGKPLEVHQTIIAPPVTQSTQFSAAIHLKVGAVKREPWVLRMGMPKSAIINTVSAQNKAFMYNTSLRSRTPQDKVNEQAFRAFAADLNSVPLDALLTQFPGSTSFETDRISSFQIFATYDDERNYYDPYERFILVTGKAKYKGSFEADTSILEIEPVLRFLLGPRYSRKTISGYPFV